MRQKFVTTAEIEITCDTEVEVMKDVLNTLERQGTGNSSLRSVKITITPKDLDFQIIQDNFSNGPFGANPLRVEVE